MTAIRKGPKNPMYWKENTCSDEEWDERLYKKFSSTIFYYIKFQSDIIAMHIRGRSAPIKDMIEFTSMICRILNNNSNLKYDIKFVLMIADYMIDSRHLGVKDKLRHLPSGHSYERVIM